MFCSSANTSGMFNSISRFANTGMDQRNYTAREDVRIQQQADDETIYIKRHLLKTRGITSLTRSINDVSIDFSTRCITLTKISVIGNNRSNQINEEN